MSVVPGSVRLVARLKYGRILAVYRDESMLHVRGDSAGIEVRRVDANGLPRWTQSWKGSVTSIAAVLDGDDAWLTVVAYGGMSASRSATPVSGESKTYFVRLTGDGSIAEMASSGSGPYFSAEMGIVDHVPIVLAVADDRTDVLALDLHAAQSRLDSVRVGRKDGGTVRTVQSDPRGSVCAQLYGGGTVTAWCGTPKGRLVDVDDFREPIDGVWLDHGGPANGVVLKGCRGHCLNFELPGRVSFTVSSRCDADDRGVLAHYAAAKSEDVEPRAQGCTAASFRSVRLSAERGALFATFIASSDVVVMDTAVAMKEEGTVILRIMGSDMSYLVFAGCEARVLQGEYASVTCGDDVSLYGL